MLSQMINPCGKDNFEARLLERGGQLNILARAKPKHKPTHNTGGERAKSWAKAEAAGFGGGGWGKKGQKAHGRCFDAAHHAVFFGRVFLEYVLLKVYFLEKKQARQKRRRQVLEVEGGARKRRRRMADVLT